MQLSIFPMSDTLREEFNNQMDQLRRLTTHAPSLGRFVEISLITLMRKYFPSSIDFCTGFIYPTNPSVHQASPQLDIICYDRLNFPVAFDIGEFKVVLPKAVKGIIELKSTLTKASLRQVMRLSESSSLLEVPLSSKLYILSIKSKISPKATLDFMKEYMDGQPAINKFFGVILSLDWEEIIVCHTYENRETAQCTTINHTITRLAIGKLGLSPFFLFLLKDIFDLDCVTSVANLLAPSLYKPVGDSATFKLYAAQAGSIVRREDST